MPTPTAEFWKQVAAKYESYWQFPNCVGSIDGKHILMQAPPHSGSTYSVVLLAVVDARYKFVVVDVGAQGKHSDGHVFSNSTFGKRLKNGSLNLPSPAYLPGTTTTSPFVFVADEAFLCTITSCDRTLAEIFQAVRECLIIACPRQGEWSKTPSV